MSSPADDAPQISWQEAVTRLTRERTLAEGGAAILKKYGDPAAIARGALAYGEAKADYDGIVAGLCVALARKAAPASLPELQALLQQAFARREAFCDSVRPLLPAPLEGRKGVVDELVKGAVGPVIDAIKAIWLRTRDDDALMRKALQTRLEAAAWLDFAAVPPAP